MSLGHFCDLAFCPTCSIWAEGPARADMGENDLFALLCISLIVCEVEHLFYMFNGDLGFVFCEFYLYPLSSILLGYFSCSH